MNKYFTVTYQVVGGKRTDFVMIWAKSVREAINEFENTEIETAGFKVKYTEYAIVKIEG